MSSYVRTVLSLGPAFPSEVVALGVEEEVLEQRPGRLGRGRLAGTQATVDILQRLLGRLEMLLLERELHGRGALEQLEDLLRGKAEGLEEHRDVLAALAVDTHADRVALVHVEL